MISYTESHNFNTGCHNFFLKKNIFIIQISNEKVKLGALNACWKTVTTRPNQVGWCIFSIPYVMYKKFPL